MRWAFPDPRKTDESGLLCVGGDLNPETLFQAYSHGIFPWPQIDMPLLWFSPPERGVLDFDEFHIPRSLKKAQRQSGFRFTFNQDFEQVITECAKVPRHHQSGTWIVPELVEAFLDFHQAGFAHSVECWLGEELVGGLYGVLVWNVFSGESMFYKRTNASKLCLCEMVQRLKTLGHTWMDIQMVTPVLHSLGGKYIDREEFLRRLGRAHLNPERMF